MHERFGRARQDTRASFATPSWQPSPERIDSDPLTSFWREAERRAGRHLDSYADLHQWSTTDRATFWETIWTQCGVIGDRGYISLVEGNTILEDRFFPTSRLNFAENLLRRSGPDDALIFRSESGAQTRLSWDDLRGEVGRFQRLLLSLGVTKGERVAAMLPNTPDAVIAMIATASLGAIWASCSPDFGEDAVVDRFGQIAPAVLVVVDGYDYAGKAIDLGERIAAISARLPAVRATVVTDLHGNSSRLAAALPKAVALPKWQEDAGAPPTFDRFPFDHPLSIHFSSGTTGSPKCIVHRTGGVLLQHLKEHQLHCSLSSGDRLFFFSTCSWMMWNWLVSGLASGATLMLYDGSPFHPSPKSLFDYASEERCTHFGTSPKYLDGLRKAGASPRTTHDLSALRTLLSTGSPLSAENYSYVYDSVKKDVHLASIAGGTDILGCFAIGVPTLAVFAGELQGASLGMAVEIFGADGAPLPEGRGELVCTKAFPSMPLGFWNDEQGRRYQSTYFERFPGMWHHGDFVEWTSTGGLVFHGRSDATLNPGGVRIGTAEIYNQVEIMPEVLEAACIGQDHDGDVRVILFVRLAPGYTLDTELEARIRARIRAGTSPRHVPARIVAVPDIPRTKSGKITELAIRAVVNGGEIDNRDSLANPEALDHFRNRPELAY